jgi:hypothetical protein
VCQIRTTFFSAEKTIMGIKKMDSKIRMTITKNFSFLNISELPFFHDKNAIIIGLPGTVSPPSLKF